jgi:hypothetical protein
VIGNGLSRDEIEGTFESRYNTVFGYIEEANAQVFALERAEAKAQAAANMAGKNWRATVEATGLLTVRGQHLLLVGMKEQRMKWMK